MENNEDLADPCEETADDKAEDAKKGSPVHALTNSLSEMTEDEADTSGQATADISVTSSADGNDESEPAYYEQIAENLYLIDKKKSRASKEVRRMICECVCDPEDPLFIGCDENCLNRLLMIECSKRCPCGEFCTNQNFQKGCRYSLTVFNAGVKGWGLKTESDIDKGAFVIEYSGEVVDYEEFRQRTHTYDTEGRRHYYFMTLKTNEVIDATQKGSPSRFINHSCDPNCVTQKWTVNGYLRVGFFALRFIPAGSELSFDYQLQRYGEKAQTCFCGSENCRGIIGGEKQTPLKQVSLEKLTSWLPSNNSSPKKKGSKKRYLSEYSDDGLETELDKLLCGRNEISSPAEALDFTRLMVKAKVQYDKIRLLKVLQESSDHNTLKAFIRFKGLSLLWSWMIESADEIVDYKLEILQTLKHIPVQNKNQLEDSRLLQIVSKWSDMGSPTELTKSDNDDNGDSNSDTEAKDAQLALSKSVINSNSVDAELHVTSNESSAADTMDDADTVSQERSDKADTADDELSTNAADSCEERNVSQADLAMKQSELANFAKDLLESWKPLKEVFKIPRKSQGGTAVDKDPKHDVVQQSIVSQSESRASPRSLWPPLFSELAKKDLSVLQSNDASDSHLPRHSSSITDGRSSDNSRYHSESNHGGSDQNRGDCHSGGSTPTRDDYRSPVAEDRRRSSYNRDSHRYHDRHDDRWDSGGRHGKRWRRNRGGNRSRDERQWHRGSTEDDTYKSPHSRYMRDNSEYSHSQSPMGQNQDRNYDDGMSRFDNASGYKTYQQPVQQASYQSFSQGQQVNSSQTRMNNVGGDHVPWPPPPPPPVGQGFGTARMGQMHQQNAIPQYSNTVPPPPPNVGSMTCSPFSPPPNNTFIGQQQGLPAQSAYQGIQSQMASLVPPLATSVVQPQQQGFNSSGVVLVNQPPPPFGSVQAPRQQLNVFSKPLISMQFPPSSGVSYPQGQVSAVVQEVQAGGYIVSGMAGGAVAPQTQLIPNQLMYAAHYPQMSLQPVSTDSRTSHMVVSEDNLCNDVKPMSVDSKGSSPSTPETGPTSSSDVMNVSSSQLTRQHSLDAMSETMDIDSSDSPSATKPIPPLPPGWRTATDAEGKMYYYHVETRVTQWEPPVSEEYAESLTNDDMNRQSSTEKSRRHKQGSDGQRKISSRKGPRTPPLSPNHSPVSPAHETMRCRRAAADTTVTRTQPPSRRGPHTPPGPSHEIHGDLGSAKAQKARDAFKAKLSHVVVNCLNPYQKVDCKHARITTNEDFKFLARKLTHGLMMKELARVKDELALECNDSVKIKVKEYIKTYMKKFHETYVRS